MLKLTSLEPYDFRVVVHMLVKNSRSWRQVVQNSKLASFVLSTQLDRVWISDAVVTEQSQGVFMTSSLQYSIFRL